MIPFLDSSDALPDGEELYRRMCRDGYLFVRELIPPDVLEPVRIKWLEIARDAGWVDRRAPLEQGMADLSGFCAEPQPSYMEVMYRLYREVPEFHAIQHHPRLIDMLARMLGDTILPHARIIGRTIFPKRTEYTTPAHQDWIPIQGCEETITAWIGISDVPKEMGGLQLNAGSHHGGIYNFKPALGAGGTEITDPLDEDQWVYSPQAQGDVLFFHSLTVHRGMANTSDRLRLSIDARFQRVSDPVAPGSLGPHSNGLDWEEFYVDWPEDHPLKYYWKKWNLKVAEYDGSYNEIRDRMALELAETGDPSTRGVLERVVNRGNNPARQKRAQELLNKLSDI